MPRAQHLNIKLTRAKLEALVEDLIARTIEPCKIAVKDAGVKLSDINDVILVGGMTHAQGAGQGQGVLRQEPRKDVNPDEAVAVGAAIRAGARRPRTCCCSTSPAEPGHRDPGGVMTKMIKKHHHPDQFSQVFSTADDNQPAVTIKVFQGERELAAGNRAWAATSKASRRRRAACADRGHLRHRRQRHPHVSARTRPARRTRSRSGELGLSEAEIEKMVKDAEANAAEDHKKLELVQAQRGRCDGAFGEEEPGRTRRQARRGGEVGIEAALKEAEDSLKSDDKATIEAATEKLMTPARSSARRCTPSRRPPQRPPVPRARPPAEAAQPRRAAADDTVDAEFRK